MSTWQTMESAPRDGTDVLIWDGHRVQLASWDAGWWVLVEYTIEGATHWMPLPAPPLPGESNARIIAGPHKETR
jgi:hypothetical protein